MKALISILIIALFVFVGWKVFTYYRQIEGEKEEAQQVETGADIRPEDLRGLPQVYQSSLQAAQQNGAKGLRDWLKMYGSQVQDPRKAWIEMDYSLSLLRNDPNEAKRIFNAVKERMSTNSLVYPRIRQLEKTFQ